MCRIDDCETEVYSSKHVTARKAHVCDECHRTIAPGEKYFYAFFVSEGCGISCHTCVHCLEAAQWLVKNCGGWVHDMVREEIAEHQEEYPDLRDALEPLIFGIDCQWRRPDGDLMELPAIPRPIDLSGDA